MVESAARVAIIGSGFTGLTAAHRLSSNGVRVEVFDSGDALGGLAGGFELGGYPLERAYHFLYKTDEYMLGLVNELGLEGELTYHPSSIATYYDDTMYPMMTPVDLLRFTPLSFFNRLRAGVSVLGIGRIRNWQKLTEVTALDYLRRVAGEQVTAVIWEPLLRGKFDHYYDKVTMGWLWGRVKQRVETREKGESGERLGYFEGGFQLVVNALAESIAQNGGEIHLNTPVAAVSGHDGERRSAEVVLGSGERRSYDRVLITTSSRAAVRLLDDYRSDNPAYFEQLESIDYLAAALLVFTSEKEISPYYWHNINTPDAPFVVFLSLTALVGTERFGGRHVYYVGDYVPDDHPYMTGTEDELRQRWYGELEKIFPEFDRSSVIDDAVFRFRDAQHIVDVGFEAKIPDHQTPAEGVLLANFSQIYPMDRGTNYAVRDGNRMGERILADLDGGGGTT